MATVLRATRRHSAGCRASAAVPDLLSDAQVTGFGASASPPLGPARSLTAPLRTLPPADGPAAYAPIRSFWAPASDQFSVVQLLSSQTVSKRTTSKMPK